MADSLKSKIQNIYKLSETPIILTNENYKVLGSNNSATAFFGLKKIADIVENAKRIINDKKTGNFTYLDGKVVYVETLAEEDEVVRVIHISEDTQSSDVKAVFRSSVYEMSYRKSMYNILTSINKIAESLDDKNAALCDNIEDEAYKLFTVLQVLLDRHKCETGLRPHLETYFDLTKALSSVLNQTDMVLRVYDLKIDYSLDEDNILTVSGDKQEFAISLIKLIRGLCCFAEDNVINANLTVENNTAVISISVKSNEVISWQERSLNTDNFLKHLQNPKKLFNAFFVTDAICEFELDSVKTECLQDGEYTTVKLSLPCEIGATKMLNANPLLFIGDQFSPLTIFFSSLEK